MLPESLRNLPYLVHTNRELGLMLRGSKPLSYFASFGQEDQPECVARYLAMFDRHVATGRFEKTVQTRPTQLADRFLDRIFYTLPGEQWRVVAMIELLDRPGDWTHEREWQFGALLRYEDWQNDLWISMLPTR
ncbi:hypothetical protein HH800_04685 [Sphingobium yanoikuyae]|uniref:Uncharacterized protein n=1 Tax=Sphingobium yanoikuyae TaxID=13690 RepID=A0A6M4G3T5_SPHYA|nr:hypothetical protein [Sphingobium yanoikuyae]QJR01556.1 hypothetical protein HH800_04685 [Sphingobium yanoikuyae]